MKPRTDDELDQLLKQANVPERPEDFWEQLPRQVTVQIRRQSKEQGTIVNKSPRFDLMDWALGMGVVAVVCVMTLLLQRGLVTQLAADPVVLAAKCFSEAEEMFPNQIQAIVFDASGTRMILSEKADMPASPPLYLKICGPEGCQEVVTFSGQQVRVNGDVCDVLTDAAGNVIVAGDHLIWSSHSVGNKTGVYRIEARQIHRSS